MPAGDPAGYLPTVKRFRARRARSLGRAIKTSIPKGVKRVPSTFGQQPLAGVQRMSPSSRRNIGPYKGAMGAKKPYKSRSRRAI